MKRLLLFLALLPVALYLAHEARRFEKLEMRLNDK